MIEDKIKGVGSTAAATQLMYRAHCAGFTGQRAGVQMTALDKALETLIQPSTPKASSPKGNMVGAGAIGGYLLGVEIKIG